jgi:hypothetical protein
LNIAVAVPELENAMEENPRRLVSRSCAFRGNLGRRERFGDRLRCVDREGHDVRRRELRLERRVAQAPACAFRRFADFDFLERDRPEVGHADFAAVIGPLGIGDRRQQRLLEAALALLRIDDEHDVGLRARDRDVEESQRLGLVALARELAQRLAAGVAEVRGDRVGAVREDDAARLFDREQLQRSAAAAEAEVGEDDGLELESLRGVDGHDAHRVLRLIDETRFRFLRLAAPPRDLVDELLHRAALPHVVFERDRTHVLEVREVAVAVGHRVVDRLIAHVEITRSMSALTVRWRTLSAERRSRR